MLVRRYSKRPELTDWLTDRQITSKTLSNVQPCLEVQVDFDVGHFCVSQSVYLRGRRKRTIYGMKSNSSGGEKKWEEQWRATMNASGLEPDEMQWRWMVSGVCQMIHVYASTLLTDLTSCRFNVLPPYPFTMHTRQAKRSTSLTHLWRHFDERNRRRRSSRQRRHAACVA